MYEVHSHFVKHDACEKCGSRDNVAWYSNGTGYCFGCGAFYSRNPEEIGSNVRTRMGGTEWLHEPASSGGVSDSSEERSDSRLRPPPSDIGTHYPEVVLDWLKKYSLGVTDLLRYNVKWSPSREQLVYLFYGEHEEIILWQARNFKAGTAHKDRFFTGGTPEQVVATYTPKQGTGETAVIVEDCISGIKICRSGYTGVPVFGAKMSERKMRQICKMYKEVVWWLDSDKFTAAVKQSNLCKLMGAASRVINTTYDPKEYTEIEIQDMVDDLRYRT